MPTVNWYKGNTDLKSNLINSDNEGQIGRNILYLYDVRDSENYTCVAFSKYGKIEAKSQIIVQTLPVPPTNLRVSEITMTSVKIAWNYDISPENINYYVINYKAVNSDQDYAEISGITTLHYNKTGLIPFTKYEFLVIATNSVGRSAPSSPSLIVTTGENINYKSDIGFSPKNVQARPLTQNQIFVYWEKPEVSGGKIVGYKVYYTTDPKQSLSNWDVQNVDDSDMTKISDLQKLAIYTIRVQALTNRGESVPSAPVSVKLQQFVPSQPTNLRVVKKTNDTVQLAWKKPSHPGDTIKDYALFYNDTYTGHEVKMTLPAVENITLNNLHPNTLYYVWIAARSNQGLGAASPPIPVRTDEFVPGEPRNIQLTAINSTTIKVNWKHPLNKEQNGIIRGYQIHLQELNKEGDLVNEPIKIDVANGEVEEFNVTDLQPDTEYSIQVSAVTRKGQGSRSRNEKARTLGGVPSRPNLHISFSNESNYTVNIDASWNRPNHTYGQLLGYRLKYCLAENIPEYEILELAYDFSSYTIKDANKGAKYEIKLSGKNAIGWGQEAKIEIETPEGIPKDAPQNLTYKLQSPTIVVINWDPPMPLLRNGKIIKYGYQFNKPGESSDEMHTPQARIVFPSLDENSEYNFKVRAYTAKGYGPWSSRIIIQTPGEVPPSPKNVQAMATTEHSVQVWWDEMAFFADILGFKVLYTSSTASEDLDLCNVKTVGLTGSADLNGLEPNSMYTIRVAAFTEKGLGRLSEMITVRTTPTDVPINLRGHSIKTDAMTLEWRPPKKLNPIGYNITYGANKQFFDAQGYSKILYTPPVTIRVPSNCTEYTVSELKPFTSYQVNVTAIPMDNSYRPPAKLVVTTTMAAPKPMAKPDIIYNKDKGIMVGLPEASEEYGSISHYYLVVVTEDYAKKNKNPDNYTTYDLINAKPDSPYYIAAKYSRREKEFYLGDGKKYEGFVNRPLSKTQSYQIFVRAVVENQESLSTNSQFSAPMSLTKQPVNNSVKPGSQNPEKNPIKSNIDLAGLLWIVAFLTFIILLSFCIIMIFFAKNRNQLPKSPMQQQMLQETTMKLLCNTMPDPREMVSQTSDPVELRRLVYQTQAMIDHPPIPVTELANYIDRLKENDNQNFSQEYESIDPGQQFTWEHSNLEINKPKNRYANVIAYDHSRVVLQPLDGIPGSDYINANYCDGYRKPNLYIATQGPLAETITDFWRMVWDEKSSSIVMMTKLEERTRIKCDQYWPSRGTESYGPMFVTLMNVEELSTYCIRTFILQRTGYMDKREIRQFQFTAWPDHGVPDHPTPFLMFLRRIKAMNPIDSGPLVIHCSAGVGRTGCFIVIDSMIERLKYENTVDIYGHVTSLRAQRNYTVQTEDQYIFIYDSVLEAVIAGCSEVHIRNLYNHLQMLMQVVPGENVIALELEFKKIATIKTTGKFTSASLPINKAKNRLTSILPYESSRVFLQALRGIEGSDYINANFIDGYRYKSAYIATQGPLPETINDFWRMIWESNSNIIVMLTKCNELGREKCSQYWPSEHSMRYMFFVVEPLAEYNMTQYILREFKVTDARDGQSRTVRQFHFIDWPEQGIFKTADYFIDFITQVHKTKEQFGQEGPITVHCSAGVGRTGVFICLSIVLERIQNEEVVDLFETVRTLRTQRPGMIQNEDQYQFCYRAALEYVSTFDLNN
ncbi:hypothetical protein RND71_043757 [Anisodus tanguticus]|uniref:protein-tyrosine-phosphatase n=1 Tax=Anisodus tanguticus TaxID=243964 RepID=A0AAE1URB6_9SOLA|nr:hypothetical protein RND71_043757 [Anisodus tanguticus]